MDDERAEIRRLERQRERGLGGEAAAVRRDVRESWNRARRKGVHPARTLPPVLMAEDEVLERRRAHALAQVWPTLLGTLRSAVAEPGHIVFVADASGRLLWRAGQQETVRLAERAHLTLGASWHEDAAGTNGVGTTLAVRRPFQVYGAEHYMSAATPFTCSGAPIHDPLSGALLGVVDLTNSVKVPRELGITAVTGAARIGESFLREAALREQARLQALYTEAVVRRTGVCSALVTRSGQVVEAHPAGWLPRRLAGPVVEGPMVLPDGRPVVVERLASGGILSILALPTAAAENQDALVFGGLGAARAWVRLDGVAHELSRRHADLLAVLLSEPGGLTGERLAHEVYGPGAKTVTLRAELARLRRVLGYRLASEPYRLTGRLQADFVELDRDLSTAGLGELLDRYRGPLLPASRAPGVVALRDRLHERVRGRVLASADPDAMTRWLTSRHGADDHDVAAARAALRP